MGLALELRADHLKKNWAEEKPKTWVRISSRIVRRLRIVRQHDFQQSQDGKE